MWMTVLATTIQAEYKNSFLITMLLFKLMHKKPLLFFRK